MGESALVRDAAGRDVVVLAPFGKGRLVLIGCTTEKSQSDLVDEILDFVYRWRDAAKLRSRGENHWKTERFSSISDRRLADRSQSVPVGVRSVAIPGRF